MYRVISTQSEQNNSVSFVKIVLTVAISTARFEDYKFTPYIAIYILKILKEHFVKAVLENSFWLFLG